MDGPGGVSGEPAVPDAVFAPGPVSAPAPDPASGPGPAPDPSSDPGPGPGPGPAPDPSSGPASASVPAAVSAAGARRFLIASVVSQYAKAPHLDREELVEDRRKIVRLFTRDLGYELVAEPSVNPSGAQLIAQLRAFARSEERRPDDLVAVYLAGHGDIRDGDRQHVLLTADSDPDDLFFALPTAQVVSALLSDTRVRRLLLMLDACYSGQGGGEATAVVAERIIRGWQSARGAGFVVISATQPDEEAEVSTFAHLLDAAVRGERVAGRAPAVLAPDALVEAMNAHPDKPTYQRVMVNQAGLSGLVPPFLPNPRRDDRPPPVDPAHVESVAERRATELDRRLLARAMGELGYPGFPGDWRFAGRHRALADITAWLTTEPPAPAAAATTTTAPAAAATTTTAPAATATTTPVVAGEARAASGEAAPGEAPTTSGDAPAAREAPTREAAPGTSALLAVTAAPGSGKSAVLGLVAALSDPAHRPAVPLAALGLPPDAVPPPHSIDAALYVQHLTDAEVLEALADAAKTGAGSAAETAAETTVGSAAETTVGSAAETAAGSAAETAAETGASTAAGTADDLLAALRHRPDTAPPLTVLLDAVDEAATPRSLAAEVLRPLAERSGGRLRLLLGVRPHLLDALGLARSQALDLDAAPYADLAALTYCTARNLVQGAPDGPYRHTPGERVREVAEAVAAAAMPSFLVARINAVALAAEPELPTPDDPYWRASLPRLPGEAMRQDLAARLGPDADRARDLLRPLAWAQGAGLPWEGLWAPIATRLAGAPYTDDDLDWLLREAGSYVVEDTEQGRSVYRLYHPALAEHLRADGDPRAAHGAITAVLTATVPRAADGTADWAAAHPYVLRHLAAHAARAGRIDALIADPSYLPHAEPDPLLAALGDVAAEDGRRTAAVYRASADRHRVLGPAGRRSVLATDAARQGATALREAWTNGQPWQVGWATARQTGAALRAVLSGHTGGVTALACGAAGHRPFAVSSDYGTLRVWDLDAAAQHRTWRTDHHVQALACATVDGRPVALAATGATVRVWDLDSGRVRPGTVEHRSAVRALACTATAGGPIAVSGDDEGTTYAWDVATGRLIARSEGHRHAVTAAACGTADGRAFAVTGDAGGTLRAWDAATGRPFGVPPRRTPPAGRVAALALAVRDGRPLAVVAGDHGQELWTWDPATGECAVLGWDVRATAVACHDLPGGPVAVVAGIDGTAKVWDLTTGRRVSVLAGHTGWVTAVACTAVDGKVVALTGGADGTVRMWRVSAGEPGAGDAVGAGTRDVPRPPDRGGAPRAVPRLADVSEPPGRGGAPRAVPRLANVSELPGRGGASRAVPRLTDVLEPSDRGGAPGAVPRPADGDRDTGASRVPTRRPGGVASAPPRARLAPFHGDVRALACAEVDGRTVLVAAGRGLTAQVLDLATGSPVRDLTGPAAWTEALACAHPADGPVAVLADSLTRTGALQAWDLRTGQVTALGAAAGDAVRAVACGRDGHRQLVVTGGESGTVRVLDLATGQVAAVLGRHGAPVAAAACTTLGGRPVAVTGAYDGTVRVWDLATGRPRELLDGLPPVADLACAVQGGRTRVVIGDTEGAVRVWDPDPGSGAGSGLGPGSGSDSGPGPGSMASPARPALLLPVAESVTAVACAVRDGGLLVAAATGPDVRVWDAAAADPGPTVLPQPGPVGAVAFGPGAELAVGCGWDVLVLRPGDAG